MPSSSLPRDLLQHADDLISGTPGRPQQVALRRSISTSYYAAWHAICQAVAAKFSPDLQPKLTRTPDHHILKNAAHKLRKGSNPWIEAPCSQKIDEMCQDIIYLQQRRHQADYDISIAFSKNDAVECHQRANRIQEAITWSQRHAKTELDALLLELLCVKCPKRD